MTHIGTLREKPLHASLKEWYSEPGDLIEHPFGGYVIDLVREDILIEIQTGSFSGMKKKVRSLLDDGHMIRIVYPVATEKWIVKVDADGTILDRRKSPKGEELIDVFTELVAFPELLGHPRLEIEVLLTKVDELRVHQPGKAWRRKGWVVAERHLLEVVGKSGLDRPDTVIPLGIAEEFTTRDLASALGRPIRIAQQTVYCLRKAGILEVVGKTGNSLVYRSPHCS